MLALKLKIEPTRKQYKLFDEMFKKWASICNRISSKGKIKETLNPETSDKNQVMFNATQLNQSEKDVNDLRRAMQGLKKQKIVELNELKERRIKIYDAITKEECKERDKQKTSNFRPKNWIKFHTPKHWNNELEKLNKQIKKKQQTIEKINAGKIYFKPKRVGLWSNSFMFNFGDKKLLIRPFENKEIIVTIITEPKQKIIGKKGGKSSQKGRDYMKKSIINFLIFALHSKLFGLNSKDKPLFYYKISENVIKTFKKNDSFDDFYNEITKNIEKKVNQKLTDEEKKTIQQELSSVWQIKEYDLRKNFELSKEYLECIKILSEKLKERQLKRLKELRKSFQDKVSLLKKEFNDVISKQQEDIILDESKKVFDNLAEFKKAQHSEEYVNTLNELAKHQFEKKEFIHINKYPILIRKPLNKTKKLKNLKPDEWKYYIQIAYEPINKPKEIEIQKIMGIDRGLSHLLALSIFDPKQTKSEKKFILNELVDNPIIGWKWRLRKLKKSIQHLERRLKAQKNIHIYENQMKKKFRSIENRIENLYHNISRKIVNSAEKNNACIVFENLEKQSLKQHGRKKTGKLKKLNYFLSLFDYGKIASLINYKAQLKDIPVFQIDPAYTSQNCAKCILENNKFKEPIVVFYLEDLKIGENIPQVLLEDTNILEAKIKKIKKGKIELEGKTKDNQKIELIIKKSFNRIVVFHDKEEIGEFNTKIEKIGESEKTAVSDSVYKRGKEKIKGKPIYTGNKKAGYCTKHGQIDADLNAARVIALCKYFNINKPEKFN